MGKKFEEKEREWYKKAKTEKKLRPRDFFKAS